MYEALSIHIANTDMRELREDNYFKLYGRDRYAEIPSMSGKQPRKRMLSHESNQADRLLETDISESNDGNASSMNISLDSGPCLPVQYPIRSMGSVKGQNFGSLQFNPDRELKSQSHSRYEFTGASKIR